ncbi:probable xyloglucan galactosyltransferase GT20 [Selaginella moellendorffii]|nr:probable xyloglucan galactosyltransferase GT20 [Selaginella moellendorffii]|eukprot:XP_002987516.2 probable xyloglucan galactosyltransferase GT20 [Selaginella moellendorffii]
MVTRVFQGAKPDGVMAKRMNAALLLLLLRRLIIVPSMLLICVFCIWTVFGLAAFTVFSQSRHCTAQKCTSLARRWIVLSELKSSEAFPSNLLLKEQVLPSDGFGRSTKSTTTDHQQGAEDGDTVTDLEMEDAEAAGNNGHRRGDEEASLPLELKSLGFSGEKGNARRQMIENRVLGTGEEDVEDEDDDYGEDEDEADETQEDSRVIRPGLLRIMDELREHSRNEDNAVEEPSSSCSGKWIYSYNLPARFNADLVALCDRILPWYSMCDYFENSGMGKAVTTDRAGVLKPAGRWHKTNQYMLEVLFHARLKEYACLTDDPAKAQLFYIPYYGGLDVFRYHYANVSYEQKDELGVELMGLLEQHESWRRNGGIDHFLVLGKITWDFRRTDTEWGNTLLMLPGLENVTRLLLERDPWNANDVGVPHPTYFHPASDRDVEEWLHAVASSRRDALFSFAGMPRTTDSIRAVLIAICTSQPRLCRFLECSGDVCLRPESTTELFLASHFCLQPVGDSATRRSVFDSLIAGCIPVLFSQETAYVQYPWHLPARLADYSVYVPAEDVKSGTVDIARLLAAISPSRRRRMRRTIVTRIIPRLLYAAPAANLTTFRRDAFQVSITSLLEKSRSALAALESKL